MDTYDPEPFDGLTCPAGSPSEAMRFKRVLGGGVRFEDMWPYLEEERREREAKAAALAVVARTGALGVGAMIGTALGDALVKSFADIGKDASPAPPRFLCPSCVEGEALAQRYRVMSHRYADHPAVGCIIAGQAEFYAWPPSCPYHACDVPERCHCYARTWHTEEPAYAGPIRLLEGGACFGY